MIETGHKRILIVDDDPSHLEIYGMIVGRAGYFPVPVLVRFAGPEPVPEEKVAAVLLDYRLNSVKTTPEIAQEIKAKHPQAPILVLSDLWSMPADIAPYASEFVRKGEPENLLNTLLRIVTNGGGSPAENHP
jgi:DNA-binding NtrC family response regulator